MRRGMLVGLALGATTLCGGAVLAEQAGRTRGAELDRLKQEIGLSDEQAAAIRELRLQERKAAIARRADMRVARLELEALLSAPTLDEAAIASHTKRIAELQQADARARIEGQVAVRRAVSPEQYQKLRQIRSRMLARRGWHGRQWRHHGSGDGSPSAPEAAPAPAEKPGASGPA